jgi:hypothetical protein
MSKITLGLWREALKDDASGEHFIEQFTQRQNSQIQQMEALQKNIQELEECLDTTRKLLCRMVGHFKDSANFNALLASAAADETVLLEKLKA